MMWNTGCGSDTSEAEAGTRQGILVVERYIPVAGQSGMAETVSIQQTCQLTVAYFDTADLDVRETEMYMEGFKTVL